MKEINQFNTTKLGIIAKVQTGPYQKLAQARDLLLPRLMSGKIEI